MMQAECRTGGAYCALRNLLLVGVDAWHKGIAGMDSLDKITCRINLFSAVRHIVGTSAAERLAAPLPTHGG